MAKCSLHLLHNIHTALVLDSRSIAIDHWCLTCVPAPALLHCTKPASKVPAVDAVQAVNA
eukprot:5758680-Pleurochrysis_carterae.AAC.1